MLHVLVILAGTSLMPPEPAAAPLILTQVRPRPRLRRLPIYRGRPRLGPGGLRAHEDGLGHCCRRHIGKGLPFMRRRLKREKLQIVSSFYTMRDARVMVRKAIRENTERINFWLRAGAQSPLTITARAGAPIGHYITAYNTSPRPGYTATFVLVYNEFWPGNFQVVTGVVSK